MATAPEERSGKGPAAAAAPRSETAKLVTLLGPLTVATRVGARRSGAGCTARFVLPHSRSRSTCSPEADNLTSGQGAGVEHTDTGVCGRWGCACVFVPHTGEAAVPGSAAVPVRPPPYGARRPSRLRERGRSARSVPAAAELWEPPLSRRCGWAVRCCAVPALFLVLSPVLPFLEGVSLRAQGAGGGGRAGEEKRGGGRGRLVNRGSPHSAPRFSGSRWAAAVCG